MSEIAIAVRLEADADSAELEDATSQLRRELLELDVDDVKAPAGGEAPPGTRGAVGAEIGTLLVAAGRAAIGPVVAAIQSWVAGARAAASSSRSTATRSRSLTSRPRTSAS